MEWSDEDVERAWQAWRATPARKTDQPHQRMDDAMRRVMSLAISIKAASKRPLTREQVRYLCDVVREHESKDAGDLLAEYIDILGATVATLTAERDEWCRKATEAQHGWRTSVDQVATLQAKVAELERGGSDARAERDAAREDVTALRAEVERLKARKWIQCTSVSNECLGGCASLAEHDRYRHRELLNEVENLRPMVALHEDMTRLKREAESRAETAESRLAAIREALTKARTVLHRGGSCADGLDALNAALEGDAPQEERARDAALAVYGNLKNKGGN